MCVHVVDLSDKFNFDFDCEVSYVPMPFLSPFAVLSTYIKYQIRELSSLRFQKTNTSIGMCGCVQEYSVLVPKTFILSIQR